MNGMDFVLSFCVAPTNVLGENIGSYIHIYPCPHSTGFKTNAEVDSYKILKQEINSEDAAFHGTLIPLNLKSVCFFLRGCLDTCLVPTCEP